MNIMASACLLGVPCRYDGRGNENKDLKTLMKYHNLIPICPEQLGGMKTPRTPSERVRNKVLDRDGNDVTFCFETGASCARYLAETYHSHLAVLKERSPSCGSGYIYDGTFSGVLVPGDGVTADRFKQFGITVLGESKCSRFIQMEDTGEVLETERLILRKLAVDDFNGLCAILKDEEVMYAYEHAFSDAEVAGWIERQIEHYETWGFGLWAVELKRTGELIGQCGITMQEWEGRLVPEIGYLFEKKRWHQGFAAEAAKGCRQLAFEFLGFEEVYSMIRDNNVPSIKVALRNGMTICGSFVKHYYHKDMTHVGYRITKKEWEAGLS